MLQFVDFDRYPPGEELEGLVEWFWSVSWDLPDGDPHHQQVLSHPAGNISVGTIDDDHPVLDPPQGRVYGVQKDMSHRLLTGQGWTVAARTTVGGLGVFLDRPARSLAASSEPLGTALPGLDASSTVTTVSASPDNKARVGHLRQALTNLVAGRNPDLLAEARLVASIARHAETDRSICQVGDLAHVAGISVRSLQRLFDRHVGVSPSFVIRRWRIIEAAEAAKFAATETGNGRDPDRADPNLTPWRGWATLAAELGYADQAHLSRDFRHHLGVTPSQYVADATAT